ncbi:MAG: DUF1624 domain-containing protein [Oscillospiraceae bacterium]|nr:DUF1624 domain-containing protein [Oscillospiraceae bacterium]
MKNKHSGGGSSRAGFLDEVRGFAIICMVVYHALFILNRFYAVPVPVFFDDWFSTVRDIFAGAFIFISGIVCRYSSNNLKRGVLCFFLAMGATFVTALISPQNVILFGVLHMLGLSMMLYGISEKASDYLPTLVGLGLFILLFAFTWNIRSGTVGLFTLNFDLPRRLYDVGHLYPLGFRGRSFGSADYFPLMPWGFLFAAGTYFGVFVKNGDCPSFFYSTRVRFLAAVGRYTLWVYVLHVPIVFGICWLIFGRLPI